MGVLPLQFAGTKRVDLNLDGTETFDFEGIEGLSPRGSVKMTVKRANGETQDVQLDCRLDTQDEFDYYQNGGILHYVLRRLAR